LKTSQTCPKSAFSVLLSFDNNGNLYKIVLNISSEYLFFTKSLRWLAWGGCLGQETEATRFGRHSDSAALGTKSIAAGPVSLTPGGDSFSYFNQFP
jgi:hypothetical protein